jgi:hypothetical protein
MAAVQSVLVDNNEDYCAAGNCSHNWYEIQNAILPQCGGSNVGR